MAFRSKRKESQKRQRSEVCSPLLSRIRLLWLKYLHSPYTQMSFSVLREICCYLSFAQFPVVFNGIAPVICIFDASSKTWVRHPLDTELNVQYMKAVCIGAKRVFLCGGRIQENRHTFSSKATLIWEDGVTSQHEPLKRDRFSHTLVFDEFTMQVYVFGGNGTIYTALRSCEQFDLQSQRWSQMSNMYEPRSEPFAALYKRFVYVCSEQFATMTFEKFSTVSGEFSLLSIGKGTILHPLFVVVDNDELVLVTERAALKWKVGTWELVQKVEPKEDYRGDAGSAMVYEGFVYSRSFQSQNCRLSLHTLEQIVLS